MPRPQHLTPAQTAAYEAILAEVVTLPDNTLLDFVVMSVLDPETRDGVLPSILVGEVLARPHLVGLT